MRNVMNRLIGRCPTCGQKTNSNGRAALRLCEINQRVKHRTGLLGRTPLAQNCPDCGQIIFEGEHGFVHRYLLVDIV